MNEKKPAEPMASGGPRPSGNTPDPPQFLSTGAMQDPTLRTPGSEIPETIYAASDAEPFDIRNMHNAVALPATRDNSVIAILIAILLLGIIAATTIYLYRNTHRPASPGAAPPLPSLNALPQTSISPLFAKS